MLDIPSISAIVAAMGVLIGVVIALIELRNLVKTRQTDLVMRLYSTFGSREFQEAYVKVMATEAIDIDAFLKKQRMESWQVGVFFEGVGVLLHRGLIDIGLVDDLFSTPIKDAWENMKLAVEARRKRTDRPSVAEWFEYLYNEMQKREQQLASKTT